MSAKENPKPDRTLPVNWKWDPDERRAIRTYILRRSTPERICPAKQTPTRLPRSTAPAGMRCATAPGFCFCGASAGSLGSNEGAPRVPGTWCDDD